LVAAAVSLWLLSPFTVSISTRGNGEALVTCMLLGLLLALQAGKACLGAFFLLWVLLDFMLLACPAQQCALEA
jgi:hypothetical protein